MNEMKQRTAMAGVLAIVLGLAGAGAAEAQAPGEPGITSARSVRIEFDRMNASVGGEAVLTSIGENTMAVVDLTGVPDGTDVVGFLVAGHCADGGNVIAPLGTIEVSPEGRAELRAELPFKLEDVTGEPVALEIRSTAPEATKPLACAESHVETADETAPTAPEAIPLPGPSR